MTVCELFEWALSHGAIDLELKIGSEDIDDAAIDGEYIYLS